MSPFEVRAGEGFVIEASPMKRRFFRWGELQPSLLGRQKIISSKQLCKDWGLKVIDTKTQKVQLDVLVSDGSEVTVTDNSGMGIFLSPGTIYEAEVINGVVPLKITALGVSEKGGK